MILTKEFLQTTDSCTEGYRFGLENNLIGNDYDDAIQFCLNNDKKDFADWLIQQKTTELYVRSNGSTFSMGAYQVFNPITGIHTKCETEEEAKLLLCNIAKQVLELHCPIVVQELINENGDSTWLPTEMNKTLKVI